MTSVERMMRDDYASQHWGIEILKADPGDAIVTMTISREMLNGFAITHGGMIFAMADTAFAIACNETDAVTVASGADITFLKPTREGDKLTAHARRVALTGRSGIYDITVSNEAGEAVAEFRGRSRTTNMQID